MLLVACLLLVCPAWGQFGGPAPTPSIPAVKSDLPYIRCGVCEALAKNAYRQVKAARDKLKPGKKVGAPPQLPPLQTCQPPLQTSQAAQLIMRMHAHHQHCVALQLLGAQHWSRIGVSPEQLPMGHVEPKYVFQMGSLLACFEAGLLLSLLPDLAAGRAGGAGHCGAAGQPQQGRGRVDCEDRPGRERRQAQAG